MVSRVHKNMDDANRNFLLHAISTNDPSVDRLWIYKGRDLDWGWLFHTAKRNRVTGIFVRNLKNNGIFDQIPAEFRSCFEAEVIKAKENFNNAYVTLKEITGAFREARIPLLVFKGGIFAEDLYEEPCDRSFFDIDLLVPKAELAKSEEVLSRLKYRFYCPAAKWLMFIPLGNTPQNGSGLCFSDDVAKQIYLSYHYHFTYVVPKQDRRLNVDLHWHLFKDGMAPVDEPHLWEHTKKTAIKDMTVETFRDEAAAVFCAARIALSGPGGNKLIVFSDLMRLLNRINDKNTRGELMTVAREWGARRHLAYTLKLLHQLFQFDISRFPADDKPGSLWSRALFKKDTDRSLWTDEYSNHLYRRRLFYGIFLELGLGRLPRKSIRAFIRMGVQFVQKKQRSLLGPPKVNRQIKAELGRHFLIFIEKNMAPINQIKKVSSADGAHSKRCAYKLSLADGTAVKVRSLAGAREAKRIFSLSGLLDRNYFPQVLRVFENKMLLEWMKGKPLDPSGLDRQTICEAAQIQARLHKTIVPEHLSERVASEERYWLSRLEKSCGYLIERKIITGEQGRALTDMARGRLPRRFDIGLTHRDFRPEHLMRDQQGRLKVIDLELVSVSAVPFDLARTVYLWPMSPSQRQEYFEAYSQIRGAHEFFNHFLFWITLVLVESAAFRDHAGRENIGQTLKQIETILKSADGKDIFNMYGLRWGSNDKVAHTIS